MRFAFQNALCLPILSRWAVSTCGQQAGWQSVRGLGGYRRELDSLACGRYCVGRRCSLLRATVFQTEMNASHAS